MQIILGIGHSLWDTLRQMAPYLLFGFLVAGLLSTVVSPELVQKHLGGRGFKPVWKAALLGVPLPLCSCGVIPVAMSLHRQGARRAPVVAFLLSTPQTGVDSILVTLGLLGPVMAVYRPIAALVTGLVGGTIENVFGESEAPLNTGAIAAPAPATAHGWKRLAAAFRYGFSDLPRDIGRPILFGMLIAAAIAFFVPDDFFSGLLGGGIFAMLAILVMAIPMYVCATASIPIAAAMIAKGLSPGAALVFLIAGPGTNAAGISTIWKIMGRRSALLYVLSVVVCSLAAGLLLDFTFKVSGVESCHQLHAVLPPWAETGSAVALLAVLAGTIVPRRAGCAAPAADAKDAAGGKSMELEIRGMTCAHCEQTVRKALEAVPGVVAVSVSWKTGKAFVTGAGVDRNALVDAVQKAGYEVAG